MVYTFIICNFLVFSFSLLVTVYVFQIQTNINAKMFLLLFQCSKSNKITYNYKKKKYVLPPKIVQYANIYANIPIVCPHVCYNTHAESLSDTFHL